MLQTKRGCAKQARSQTRDIQPAKATPSPGLLTTTLPGSGGVHNGPQVGVAEDPLYPWPTRAGGSNQPETRPGDFPTQPNRRE